MQHKPSNTLSQRLSATPETTKFNLRCLFFSPSETTQETYSAFSGTPTKTWLKHTGPKNRWLQNSPIGFESPQHTPTDSNRGRNKSLKDRRLSEPHRAFCAMSSIYFDHDLPLSDYTAVRCIAWSTGEARAALLRSETKAKANRACEGLGGGLVLVFEVW